MMEVMCLLYGYPDSMADTTRGESQYKEISIGVANNPGVRRLLEHMESEYDLQQIDNDPQKVDEDDSLSMPAEMEEFLRELESRHRDIDA